MLTAVCPGFAPPDFSVQNYPVQLQELGKLHWHLSGNALKSTQCTGTVQFAPPMLPAPCVNCAALSNDMQLARTLEVAANPQPGTNYKYFGHAALESRARELDASLKATKLDMLNRMRALGRITVDVDFHKRLLVALAKSDVPRNLNFIQAALKRGSTAKFLLQSVQNMCGKLRSYTDKECDTSKLVLLIGGPRLLYAMNQAGWLVELQVITQRTRAQVISLVRHGLARCSTKIFVQRSSSISQGWSQR